jgi:sugar phosphate isomerase/epimerase
MRSNYSRRHFLKNTAVAGAGASILGFGISSCSSEIQKSAYMDNIGLQLWTVRNQLAENPQATLEAVKNYGYKQIELMDTEQFAELAPMAKDLDLDINSSFMNFSILTGRWDLKGEEAPENYGPENLIEEVQRMGLSHLVFGYMLPGERSSLDAYKSISDKLNVFGEQCNAAGIQLCYHNHSFEFAPMEGSNGFEVLMERVDPDKMKFELDVFWASIAGVEPVGLMKKMEGRLGLIHLKDKLKDTPIIYDEGKVPAEAFKELGNGIVDIKGVLAEAERQGVTYCMVEQDASPDPVQSIGQSMDYLDKVL